MRFAYDLATARFHDEDPSMWRSRNLLPVPAAADLVTLGEGGTPLHPARIVTGARTFWKDETRNPSGSHKDRALSVSLTVARAEGTRDVVVASAGSTALAAATYAARAGIGCTVIVGGDASDERLVPLVVLGARVLRLRDGSLDDALDLLSEIGPAAGLRDVSTRRSGDPWGTEGPKTIAHEIARDLARVGDDPGAVPDCVVVPVGGGGTLAAVWRGFGELVAMGLADRVPRIVGLQPDTYPTLVTALERGWTSDEELRAHAPVARPVTVQVKTAHTYAPDGAEALEAVRASGGTMLAMSDAEALEGVRELGALEGVYAEPSSGVVVAAVRRLVRDGFVSRDETVVALVCGGGHRETAAIAAATPIRPRDVASADLAEVLGEAGTDP